MKRSYLGSFLILVSLLLIQGLFLQEIMAQAFPFLKSGKVICGAERTKDYFPKIEGLRVGVVANPGSRVGFVHLVDTLLASGIDVCKVFAPEHGFRGEAEAGELIRGGKDEKTGLPVISLYGNHRKPTPEDLAGLDLVLFDLQDVGVRFYTYISTLHYVMEACADEGIPLMLTDRPNPNGFYIDGPVLDPEFSSFVGMHSVPVVYGMTIGEYAQMIVGEGWLPDSLICRLTVVPCLGYDHETEYVVPVKPSPNLPNQTSIYLYPSLCLFEGTTVSLGRGTPFPFQVYGHPALSGSFSFTPESIPGVSANPPHLDNECFGQDLRVVGLERLQEQKGLVLDWLIDSYENLKGQSDFFISYFNTLAGTDRLQDQIIRGLSVSEIRKSWQPELDEFREIRKKYLLYPDFR